MTDENNNTGDKPETSNILQFPKGGKDKKSVLGGGNVQQVATGNKPEPMVYRFYLHSGDVIDVNGYLAAGTNQIIMGDEDGLLLFLAPLDSIQHVVRLDSEDSESEAG